MSIDYAKWDEQMDVEGLKNDLADVSSNKREYEEVPQGTYEVKITKLELDESESGNPMVVCWFKIVNDCPQKGQLIFMYQVIHIAFGLHKANEFLRSLKTTQEITFDSFKQYNLLLNDIMEEIDKKYEYQLAYGENKKGYKTFEIEDVFSLKK